MSAHHDILEKLRAPRPKVYTAICKDLSGEWDLRIEYAVVTPQGDREVEQQIAIQNAKESCAGAWERIVEYAPCMSTPDTSTIACIGLFEGGVELLMLDDTYFHCSA